MNTDNTSQPTDPKKNKNVLPVEIPVNGSLGLLALGYVGIKAWREKRNEQNKSTKK